LGDDILIEEDSFERGRIRFSTETSGIKKIHFLGNFSPCYKNTNPARNPVGVRKATGVRGQVSGISGQWGCGVLSAIRIGGLLAAGDREHGSRPLPGCGPRGRRGGPPHR